MNISQQILALDARYNAYRAPNNPQFRTLYIRRRSQLLRENAKKEKVDPTCRRQYLYIRKQLLSKRYSPSESSQLSSRSPSTYSRVSSFETSFDSLHIDPTDTSHGHSPNRPSHRRYHSSGSFKFLPPPDKVESPPRGVVPTKKAEASRKMAGNTTLGENYAFAGMYHIFDQHLSAVTAIKFANDDKYRLACSSSDCTLSVCRLMPSPPSVICTLRGHTATVSDFDWSVTNDFILSASLDGSACVWNPTSGACLSTVNDNHSCGMVACRFQPSNNNMFMTGNQKGHISVFNTSTGKGVKGGTGKVASGVCSMEFDSSGMVLWVGDEKGSIYSFCFDIATGRLHKSKRIAVSEGCPVTSLGYRSWISREARDPMLLVNVSADCLQLYRVTDDMGGLKLKLSFPIAHRTHNIRSCFCPLMSFRQGACVVTGSEDMAVYFFDVERSEKPCVNKLLGHSAPVLDVCWNYDESLLASCDTEGTVIVWKREQPKYV
ncbi:WD repeat-containing protein 13 isoform X2 [Nematostella vectensis]|uniref:WD repeat-containing protein 13 isoform X2 n=1 Tax=Nematostella vectensis TaxID=45351 RepID=UPI0020778C70|nr:WD repeat-containing protein 13 isoform X2 [Nematostella vectensis]